VGVRIHADHIGDFLLGQFKTGLQPRSAISYIINDHDSFQSEHRALSVQYNSNKRAILKFTSRSGWGVRYRKGCNVFLLLKQAGDFAQQFDLSHPAGARRMILVQLLQQIIGNKHVHINPCEM